MGHVNYRFIRTATDFLMIPKRRNTRQLVEAEAILKREAKRLARPIADPEISAIKLVLALPAELRTGNVNRLHEIARQLVSGGAVE